MTSADTADYWVVLVADPLSKDKQKTASLRGVVTSNVLKFTFSSHRGLVELEPYIQTQVTAIRDWEKKHKRKLEEFKALKEELGL